MNTNESPEQVHSEIATRISLLESLSENDLKSEMDDLTVALIQNPEACMLLLPEEIGKTVIALRRIVGTAVATASTPKTRAKKETAKRMTQEELAAALDDEDF